MKKLLSVILAVVLLAAFVPAATKHLFFDTNRYWASDGNLRTDGLIESYGPTGGLKLWFEQAINGTLTMNSAGAFSFSVEAKSPLFTAELLNGYYARALTGAVTDSYSGGLRSTPLYVGDGVIATVAVHTAGTVYTVGDILTVASGTGGTVTVATISGGGGTGPVTAVTVSAGGLGYTPAAGLATTGGTGTGCKITVSTVTARTVTRHNYIDLLTPTLTFGAAVTNATVLRFDAAAGTHKAVDAATGFATSGWMKVNLSGTLGYIPIMTTTAAIGTLAGVSDPNVQITAGTGTGLTVNSAGNLVRQVYKVTITYAALATAGATSDKVIATLPAKTKIVAMYADTTAAYSGGTVSSVAMIVGNTTGGAQYIATHDVKTAAIVRGLIEADMGTELLLAAKIQDGGVMSWTATTPVSVRITCGTDTCNHLTAGSTTFYIVTERY